jgi:flagellar basal-body rod protein FlgF
MENALLIGLSRQMALQNQMNAIANNLANLETAGYKGDSLKFEEFVMPVATIDGMGGSDGQVSYVHQARQIRDFSEGDMIATGNPLDVAINGKGWLAVETPDGERYTRNGHLKVDSEGRLTTADGNPVLGLGGAIVLAPEETDLTIATDGTISTRDGEKARLRIVSFDDEQRMSKAGNTLFATDEQPKPATNPRVAQGMIEQSNVHSVAEVARMIEVSRSYISTAKLLDGTNDLRQRAIEQLGRLQA